MAQVSTNKNWTSHHGHAAFPHVRIFACTAQVGGPEGGVTAEDAESAQELLLTTAWDQDAESAKAAR